MLNYGTRLRFFQELYSYIVRVLWTDNEKRIKGPTIAQSVYKSALYVKEMSRSLLGGYTIGLIRCCGSLLCFIINES